MSKAPAKPDLIWRKVGDTAVPDGEWTKAWFGAIGDGEVFMTGRPKRVAPRSLKQLRLFWALMRFVKENDSQFDYKDEQSVRRDVFFKLGEYEIVTDRWGNSRPELHSIAFEKMEPSDFNDLMTRCVNLICEWTGNKPKEIYDHVMAMVADKRYDNVRR